MSKNGIVVVALAGALAVPVADAVAQGRQTGTLRGTVVDSQELVLPGVTVVVRSAALQGARTTRSGGTGTYELLGLPPGRYTILFSLDGFNDVEETVTVPLGGIVAVHAMMSAGAIAETVEVTDVVTSALESTETSHNVTAGDIERLPVRRDVFGIAELSPGLTSNAPSQDQLTIGGAFGYDNAYLIDGVDVNDNIFGTPNDLFIEDALRETQVLTSGISAEYGRFSGGVINVITRSGGDTFSGSFRTNLYTPDWTERTPFEVENDIDRTGTLANNTTYETTVGGPVVQDRLWFYYANRVEREAQVQTFNETGTAYDDELKNDRNLFKLTGRLSDGHRLEGSYMRNATDDTGPTFGFTIDPAGLRTRQIPNDLIVATYRGATTSRLFTELQVSRRQFGLRNSGGTSTSIVDSPFLTLTQSFSHYNAPYFDATDPQDRDNLQFTGSGTYFLDAGGAGTHSIKSGFEHFTSTLRGGNSQSATGYVFDADYAVNATGGPVLDANGRLTPVFVPGATLMENWRPQRGSTLDITTLSVYVNDTWQVGNHLTLNLGVRAERVDSEATGNIAGVDTSTVVPRLAAALDPSGNGRVTLQATYGHYAGRYSEPQFNQNTNVGTPDLLFGVYTGPAGQGRDFAPGFDPDNYTIVQGIFPVRNVFFDDNLRSPLTKELTVGAGVALGSDGFTKATYIRRTMSDLVEDFYTADGGSTTIVEGGQSFGTFTNRIFQNTDALERTYEALELLGHYRLGSRFVVDGSVTFQIRNEGNFQGEATNQPAISSSAFDFPEITPEDRYFPVGRLDGFQQYKTRLWGIYTLPLGGAGNVDIAGLWRYDSGRVYSLVARNVGISATQQAILDDLGYPSGPSGRDVFFAAGRGSETHPGYGLLDMSIQYSLPIWRALNPWLKAEIFNLLNNDKQIGANTTVTLDTDGPVDELGIPTRYIEGPRFGQPTSVNHYPQYLVGLDGLRTFRMALGFRF